MYSRMGNVLSERGVCTHIHKHTPVSMYTLTCNTIIHTHIHSHAGIHMYTYTCTCKHVYTYTHTQTHTYRVSVCGPGFPLSPDCLPFKIL